MKRSACLALTWLALSACESSPRGSVATEPTALETFIYHVNLSAVPQDGSSMSIRVCLPGEWPGGAFRPASASGSLGDGPFVVPIFHGFLKETDSSYSFRTNEGQVAEVMTADGTTTMIPIGPLTAGWAVAGESGASHLELRMESPPKPLDLSFQFDRTSGDAVEASALEEQLRRGTAVTVDGQPVAALVTRLDRVK